MLRSWLVFQRGGTKPSGACLSMKALAIYFMMGRASSPWPYEIEWKPKTGPARGTREKQRLCGVRVPVCVNLWTGEEPRVMVAGSSPPHHLFRHHCSSSVLSCLTSHTSRNARRQQQRTTTTPPTLGSTRKEEEGAAQRQADGVDEHDATPVGSVVPGRRRGQKGVGGAAGVGGRRRRHAHGRACARAVSWEQGGEGAPEGAQAVYHHQVARELD